MTIVKGIAADINPEFLERIKKAFPERQAIWQSGDDLPECARKAGCQEVIRWIERHARLSATAGQ